MPDYPFILPPGFPWDQDDDDRDDVDDTDLNSIVLGLFALALPLTRNPIIHDVAGIVTIDLADGYHVDVAASAEVEGWEFTGHEPPHGAVVDIHVRNVTESSAIPVDLATGFRLPADREAPPAVPPLDPGGVVSVFLDAGTGTWLGDGPFVRSSSIDVLGEMPVSSTPVTWADAWSNGWSAGQTGSVPVSPPTDRAGKTGLILISATGGQTPQTYPGWSGAFSGGVTRKLAILSGTTWGSLEILKRDLDGSATDTPDLSGGSIRSVAYLILSGTSAANISASTVDLVTYGAQQSFPTPAGSPVDDGSLILSILMGYFQGFTWAKPANMDAGVNTGPTGPTSRPLVVGYHEQVTAATFSPDPFTVTAGGTPGGAALITLVAAPAGA